jgi:type I restriction enzyme S subunit
LPYGCSLATYFSTKVVTGTNSQGGWVWEGQVENCIHQNHVFRARVRDDEIDPRLLSWAANTLGAPWAERNGKQSVNLASISLSKIRLMPVPVPPRPVQRSLVQAISRQMEAIEHVTTDLRRVRYRSTALRRSLLEAAFSGRLTGRASDMDRVEEMAGV